MKEEQDLAYRNYHLTAQQAATLAKECEVEMLLLTHFSARYHDIKGFEQEAKKIFPNTVVAEDFKRIPFKK